MKREKKMFPSPLDENLNTVGLGMVDPFGSYTGVPVFEEEEPVQDADDL